jgi:hypothetical protein
MYNFIFYFVFIQHLEKDGNKTARTFGAILVLFSFFGQAFCLFELFQFFYLKITQHNFLRQSDTPQKTGSDVPIIIFTVLLMVLMYFYYNDKKIDRIKKKYKNKSKVEFCTSQNTMKFLLIFLIPWIITIVLG